jgi:hypothetical protein
MPAAGRDTTFIQDTYWMVLGRAATATELADEQQGHLNKDQLTLLRGIMSSVEFSRLRRAWREGRDTHPDPEALEQALIALGPPDVFIRRSYETILGRQPDEGGASHYARALKTGERRMNIIRGLAISDEFERRWRAIPRDTQLCELANPAKWDNEEWLELLRSLGLSDDRLVMHRKPYEFTQLLYGCRRLGMLRDDASFLSVGAGHEHVLYWLANHVRRVVATDMYEGVWQDERAREGDPVRRRSAGSRCAHGAASSCARPASPSSSRTTRSPRRGARWADKKANTSAVVTTAGSLPTTSKNTFKS